MGKDIQQNQKEVLHCEASPFLLIFFFIDKAEQKLDKRKRTNIKKAVRKRCFANYFCLYQYFF